MNMEELTVSRTLTGGKSIPTNIRYYKNLIYKEIIEKSLDFDQKLAEMLMFDYLPKDLQISLLARKISATLEEPISKDCSPYPKCLEKLKEVYFISKFAGEVKKIKMPQDLNRFAAFRFERYAELAIKILEDNGYEIKPNNN